MAKLSIHTSQKTAILYGMHTSLASECMTQLSKHNAYSNVIILSKSDLDISHTKMNVLALENLDLESLQDQIEGNDLFIFQDSHFDSESRSTESFIEYNYLLPLRIAIYARKNNVNQIHLVTGSSTILKSIFMPHKAKEELEQSIRKLEFWACYVYKPLNIVGETATLRETVSSFLMDRINKASDGLLNKFVSIEQKTLVTLMIDHAQRLEKGVHVLKNEDLCVIQSNLNKENQNVR